MCDTITKKSCAWNTVLIIIFLLPRPLPLVACQAWWHGELKCKMCGYMSGKRCFVMKCEPKRKTIAYYGDNCATVQRKHDNGSNIFMQNDLLNIFTQICQLLVCKLLLCMDSIWQIWVNMFNKSFCIKMFDPLSCFRWTVAQLSP